MNIVFILVSSVAITLVLSLLKILHQIITYKVPSKPSSPAPSRSTASSSTGNNKVYIPVNAFNHKILTGSTQTLADKQKILFNMKILECQLDRLDHFMLIKGLYGCVKIIKNPTARVVNDDSDSND